MFPPDDPYVGADLDKCIDREGELHPAAAALLTEFGGYQERSPSGVGMHAIFRGELTGSRHRTDKTSWDGVFEIYDQSRYFTITGRGSGDVEYQPPLGELVERILGKPDEKARDEDLPRAVEDLIAKFPRIGALVNHEGRKDPKDASQSAWDLALAWQCVRDELTQAEFTLLLRHARRDDKKAKASRKDYVEKTWAKAQAGALAEDGDPAVRISRRYNLRGEDRIVRGDPLTDIASGSCRVYLYTAAGRCLRFPRLGDLFDAPKHNRLAATVTRAKFAHLGVNEAHDIAQAIIALCGGVDADPLEEASDWVLEFIAHAGATVEWASPDVGPTWEKATEVIRAEETLTAGRDAAARSVVICDPTNEELWLPREPLRNYSGARRSGLDFTVDMAEIGWRPGEVDVRAPGTRAERADGKVPRFHRRFYVGKV